MHLISCRFVIQIIVVVQPWRICPSICISNSSRQWVSPPVSRRVLNRERERIIPSRPYSATKPLPPQSRHMLFIGECFGIRPLDTLSHHSAARFQRASYKTRRPKIFQRCLCRKPPWGPLHDERQAVRLVCLISTSMAVSGERSALVHSTQFLSNNMFGN